MLQRILISQIMKIVILWQKWRNHSSILAIASEYKNSANLSFNFVFKENVLTEIKVLDVSKATQETDIPVKIIKANENFFAEAICFYFTNY